MVILVRLRWGKSLKDAIPLLRYRGSCWLLCFQPHPLRPSLANQLHTASAMWTLLTVSLMRTSYQCAPSNRQCSWPQISPELDLPLAWITGDATSQSKNNLAIRLYEYSCTWNLLDRFFALTFHVFCSSTHLLLCKGIPTFILFSRFSPPELKKNWQNIFKANENDKYNNVQNTSALP